jgi:signal transduction histidine kinase
MRWPLRYQILLPFGGVMLAVVVGVSLLDAVLAARRTQRQIEHQLQGVAHTLSDATFPLTDAVLKQTRGLSGAEFVLTDQHGRQMASSLQQVDMRTLPPIAHPSQEVRLGESFDVLGEPYFHTAITLPDRSLPAAEPRLLHILYPRSVLRQARWQAAYPPLVVGTLLLGLVVVLAVSLADRLARPILALGHQLRQLVAGEFQPLSVPQRNDELSDLVRSVNDLGDQLEEMRRAIHRSERLSLLGQLSGGLAHQLRNSVAGARIAVQLHKRHCKQIDQDSLAVALRQLTITESHLSRFLSAGQPMPPRPAQCDLRQIVTDVAALVGPAFSHRSVRLETDGEGPSLQIHADADQLGQLLLNLILNGMEAAGNCGWVRVTLKRQGSSVAIRVTDSGAGPAAEIVERLFEPFVTGKPEGIGLGLAVARQIAEAHGGTIRYTGSKPSCFEVVLPEACSSDSLPKATSAAAAQAPYHPVLKV